MVQTGKKAIVPPTFSIYYRKTRVYSARDRNYFSNRVINLWNSLPNHVFSASSVGAFERKLPNLRLPLYYVGP